jgi:hypothetical protein
VILVLILLLLTHVNYVSAQSGALLPGFDRLEYLELLKVSSRQGDSLYNPDLPAPERFQKIYRSPVMGLDNRWDLWITDNKTACISIRGTTMKQVSWLENFYAAMVPAEGTLHISNDFIFDYKLSDDKRAAVHVGWLIGMACLSADINKKIDSLYQQDYKNFYIMGHSQGGAIAYLLTALLIKKQESKSIPADIRFKTYCSAAPKPGNLYFAYDYENMTKGGWSVTAINAADWVPQSPFSIQTVDDFVAVSPFAHVKGTLKKQPFLKRLVLSRFYNSLTKPTHKASKRFQKNLGKRLETFIRKELPEYKSPVYFSSSDYVRTANQIVLYPDETYYDLFPQDAGDIWINHMFEPYLHLTGRYE